MTRVKLIHELKLFCEDTVKGMELPLGVQKGDTEIQTRAPSVYLMRLPDSKAAQKLVPYIIIQLIDSKHQRSDNSLPNPAYTATVRFIFCVYSKDEQEGAVMLLNVMDRVQERLLEKVQIGDNFVLDEHEGVDSVVYPDDTAPYFAGEMIGTFHIKPIQREVDFFGKEKRQFGRNV